MNCYLLVDFGSTYTKLTIVDIENASIIATSSAITTIETNIMDGFNDAFGALAETIESNKINFIDKLACSSAAGGLKMVSIGLVPELTSEAATRAALGAGAKILGTYSYELSKSDVLEIDNLGPEIILLSGGTDGGNKETIIKNARRLANSKSNAPIIVACNRSAQDEICEIFDQFQKKYYRTSNVMPSINVINVEPVRDIIREVFMEHIVYAKGLDHAIKYIGDILLPTPAAVLKAANLLSVGTDNTDGYGDLVVVDIGGATTDIHSIGYGYPDRSGVMMKGLEEPFAKRSVEGDLGMRYSAKACYEACGYREFLKHHSEPISIDKVNSNINKCHENIELVPSNKEEVEFDCAIARVCTNVAMNRHAGHVETSYSPFGNMFSQYGKDLTSIKYLIGTGGVLVNNDNPESILKAALFNKDNMDKLLPIKPIMLIDKTYILSAMGLLATVDEELAITILNKNLIGLKED